MVAQLAISVVLLVGAALFVRSTSAMLGLDVGIERERVETFRLDPRSPDDETAYALRRTLVDRLAGLPGVRRATIAFLPPFFTGNEARLTFRPEGTPEETPNESVMLNAVHAGFFETLGMSLIAGRDFVETDFQIPVEASPVILAESVARQAFGTVDVVGRAVVTPTGRRHPVVGVVADSRQRVLTSEDTTDLAFQPFRVDYSTPFLTGIVRLEEPGLDTWPDVRRMLAEVAPSVVMFEAKSVDEGIRASIGDDLLTMRVVTTLGAIAVFLAAVGLASVLARGLAERRREFGIRMALGATPRRLAGLVGRQACGVLLVGGAIGTGAAVWLSRFAESRLYGVSPLDPVSFLVSLAVVALVTALVAFPVCRRAARLQPATTLKEQ